jgi:hypothetical protein
LNAATRSGRLDCGDAAGIVGGGSTMGGVDAICVGGEIGRSVIVPVTNSSFAPFAETAVATGS